MHRHLVLFSDGTGNSPAKLVRTNVWRVYQAVDLADPQTPDEPRQFAFYDDGVGSSSWKPLAVLGGALGVGLARNVRDLYTFVCRTYQAGDKIYAFGFSRGAFTIRVLVSLIIDQGLVPYDGNEAELDRHAAAAYRAFRKKYQRLSSLLGPLRTLRDVVIERKDRLLGRRLYRDVLKIGGPESPRPIEIEFVGVWDTVDAYGFPVDELTRAIDRFIWPMTMRDLNLHRRVKRARHALALDDERNTFHPRLWNEEPQTDLAVMGVPGGKHGTTHIDQERISQVWFAGVHANVGGGYPDDTLAHVSLDWIMTEADKFKLRFSPKIWDEYRALSDENGPIYNSRHGLGGYYRYNPRRIEKLTNTRDVVIKRTKIHESVFRRIKVGHDAYAPIVLPTDFAVARIDGSIVSGDAYLQTNVSQHFGARQEHVWNWVWRRRVVYFLTLFLSLFLALTPLIWPPLPKGACISNWCFVSDAIDAVAGFLPGFTGTWTDTFASHPGKFLAIASMIGLGLWRGGRLERRIRDSMRPLWYSLPATRPRTAPPFSLPAPAGVFNRFIQWLRTRPTYQVTFRYLNQIVLPGLFLVGALYLAGALIGKLVFAVADSTGGVCHSSGALKPVLTHEQGRPFRTNALCSSTGLSLEKGGTYRLRMVIPASAEWTDNGIPAGPNGVHPDNVSIPMTLAVPLRRYLTQPWFKPIARLGVKGTDEYPLDPKPSVAFQSRPYARSSKGWQDTCSDPPSSTDVGAAAETFETEIVARSSGELFLYVNDAVLMPPWSTVFYCNNGGTARVTVERKLHDSEAPPDADLTAAEH